MLKRTNAVVLRPNAADEKKEDVPVQQIQKSPILEAIQEIKADILEIKEILQEILEEGSEYGSGEEMVG